MISLTPPTLMMNTVSTVNDDDSFSTSSGDGQLHGVTFATPLVTATFERPRTSSPEEKASLYYTDAEYREFKRAYFFRRARCADSRSGGDGRVGDSRRGRTLRAVLQRVRSARVPGRIRLLLAQRHEPKMIIIRIPSIIQPATQHYYK